MEQLYSVRRGDVPRAVAVLKDAFKDDPVWRKAFEGIRHADRRIDALYEAPVRYCLKYGGVDAPSAALEGVVAWIPGERADMSVGRMLASGGFVAGMRMGFRFMRRMMPLFSILERDRKTSMEGKRFIYLQIIGVATAHQGRGYGGKLLRALMSRCDRDGLFLYLETETERNVTMYRSYGFTVLKEITLPNLAVPMWEMVRDPMPYNGDIGPGEPAP